jgi:dTMP kinase
VTDALLFNAARKQHVDEVIQPALRRGALVICDRYAHSTLAYQGYGGGVPLDDLHAIIRIATGGLLPDRIVLFDLSPEAGLRRREAGSSSEFTRFEAEDQHSLDFHRRVRAGYLEMAAEDPARWRVVDADRPAQDVAGEVWEAVRDLVGA